jgi:hypothetical protein
MPIKCPCCDHEKDLVFYPKIPLGLHEDRVLGNAIITLNTDVCCLNCYWQGTLADLHSDGGVAETLQIAKRRVKAVIG